MHLDHPCFQMSDSEGNCAFAFKRKKKICLVGVNPYLRNWQHTPRYRAWMAELLHFEIQVACTPTCLILICSQLNTILISDYLSYR